MSEPMTLSLLSRMLADGTCTSVELTQLYLKRIQNTGDNLNCFISIQEASALEQAAKADATIQAGQAGPLTGIPMAHKDIFCTQGIKTSCGSKMLDNFIAPYNATMVQHLQDTGMVCLGKLNMDEFAMGSSNQYSHYGPTYNPWDKQSTPGGSSGASAAAVAAGLVPAASGTDTGGSIRQPAAFCGVTGLKPTYGRISRYGMIAFASSLDQAGPITRTAADAALMLQAMAGHDPKDSTSSTTPVADYSAQLNTPLTGCRIGIAEEYFAADLNPEIAQAVAEFKHTYEKLGCSIKAVSLPHTRFGVAAYYVIAPAECSANLARYDGVRYGYRCPNPTDLQDLYERSRSEGFGDEVKRRILLGTYVLSSGYYDAYYRKAQQVRRLVQQDFLTAFKEVDLILTPTTPCTAYKVDSKRKAIDIYMEDIYSIPTNLAGLPAISVPIGFTTAGLPIGGQLIAPHFAEASLLQAAHQYQLNSDWHLRQSPLAAAHKDSL